MYIILNLLFCSVDNGRIFLIKTSDTSCKLIITSAKKADEGIWRGIVTLAFRRNALAHHNSNVSVIIQGWN